ncbi:hypothetical protein ACVWXM_006022 [Bradyrhizobium sp. GM7.3]
MSIVPVNRRAFIKSSTGLAAGLVLSPALIGRAEAATLKLKCSSSLPNDPKFANGRVYYDNLVKNLKANGLGEQVEVAFFPDNQLGQEIDVINSVKLGVIDLMVSGSSISANLVPLVGTYDLGFLFSSFPQQTKAFDAGAAKPIEDALLKGSNIRIIAWAYNFGSRSVLARKPVKTPEDLAGLKIRTLPNPVITECLRLMGAAATPLAFGRNLHGIAGRRAGRARARPADHPGQQVLRNGEILCIDAAQFLAARDLFQRHDLQSHGSEAARGISRCREEGCGRHADPRARRREGSAVGLDRKGRDGGRMRPRGVQKARRAADRELHEGAAGIQGRDRHHPRHAGLTWQ